MGSSLLLSDQDNTVVVGVRPRSPLPIFNKF